MQLADAPDGVSSIALQVVAINGHDVAYRRAGEGPVVLLVHGMAGSSVTWNHVMPRLAKQFTVVAPDLLGHGESAKPRGEYSLGAHADILRDLLNALGYDRATFVGQSFGGGIVMQLAYQFPERCERLVLVNSGGLGRGVHALLRALTAPGAEQVLALACTPALRAAGNRAAAWFRRVGIPVDAREPGDLAKLRIPGRRRRAPGVLSDAACRRRPRWAVGERR